MKVLIVKTGATETFDLSQIHPGVISLGDVVRSTVILNLFSSDEVTWLTSPQAKDLIQGISLVKEVLISNENIDFKKYDLVVNLERDQKINLPMNNIVGFIDSESFVVNNEKYNLKKWLASSEIANLNWSEKLYWFFSKKWNEENYFLPISVLNSSKRNSFDIGLNWQVGIKWPTKNWPKERWGQLEEQFTNDYKVSWQEGFDNLIHYMNWINSCKVLVTHDSLGLHIAKALNKDLVALFGPTSSKDTSLGTNGRALSAEGIEGFDCLPCYKDYCHNKIHCMNYVSVDQVANELRNVLRQM